MPVALDRWMPDLIEDFELGDLELQSGATLRRAHLRFAARGRLSAARDNVVLFPTFYTGRHADNLRLVAPGRALDPERFLVVVPNLFGNGLSSSPSHHAAPEQRGPDFPIVSILDNVVAQRRLLAERFGVERVALAMGWSMGALQAFQHAASFPAAVERLLALGGAARTSPHNWVFLDGVKAALLADPEFAEGRYTSPPRRGLAAFGKVYAGWAYSQAFFREGLYRALGHASPEALLAAWAAEHEGWDANDLLAMLHTWQRADISDNPTYAGDFARALGAIEARAIVMPVSTDLYFPPEDSRHEVAGMPRAELRIIDSPWGHVAAGPDRNRAATAEIEAAITDLLDG
jgi:homoserine O-acetyltransferase/O-succinyltransferase